MPFGRFKTTDERARSGFSPRRHTRRIKSPYGNVLQACSKSAAGSNAIQCSSASRAVLRGGLLCCSSFSWIDMCSRSHNCRDQYTRMANGGADPPPPERNGGGGTRFFLQRRYGSIRAVMAGVIQGCPRLPRNPGHPHGVYKKNRAATCPLHASSKTRSQTTLTEADSSASSPTFLIC